MARYASIGLLAAPGVAIAIGVWAEFADLTPPLLLAVAAPAMALTLLSAAYLRGLATRPLAVVLLGGAIGLATFSFAAGLYIALHLARGGAADLNGADDGGAAAVFFVVHAVVGTMAGLALGGVGALLAWAVRQGRGGLQASRDTVN